MQTVLFKIEGMMCSHCQNHVSKSFKNFKGVSEVNVDLENASAEISFNEKDVTEADLRAALKDTNYTII